MNEENKNLKLQEFILFIISLALATNTIFNFFPELIHLAIGIAAITIFIKKFLKNLKDNLPYFQKYFLIKLLAILYGIYGFLFSVFFLMVEGLLLIAGLLILILPILLLGIIYRGYFQENREKLIGFYQMSVKDKKSVKKEINKTYDKKSPSFLEKVKRFNLEIGPGMVLGLLIVLFFFIGIILSFNSVFFLIIVVLYFIFNWKLAKKVSISQLDIQPKITKFIRELFSFKGLTGILSFLLCYLIYGLSLTREIISLFSYISTDPIILKNLIIALIITPHIPLIIYILHYCYRLSLRYKYFIKIWKNEKIENYNEIYSLPTGGDLAVFFAYILLITTIFILYINPFESNIYIFYIWGAISVVTSFFYIGLFLISVKGKERISSKKDLHKDNIRIPLIGLSSLIYIAIYGFFISNYPLDITLVLINVGAISFSFFFINDLWNVFKKSNIGRRKRLSLFLIHAIIPLIPLMFIITLFFIKILILVGILIIIIVYLIEIL